MARKVPNERELEEESAICSAIVEFMQGLQPSPFLDEVERVVGETRRKADLRGLRTILRDLHEWASALPDVEMARLNGELQTKFGRTLDDLVQFENVVRKVLKAGIVKTDSEFEILERFVDRASQSGAISADVETANRLLAAYKAP